MRELKIITATEQCGTKTNTLTIVLRLNKDIKDIRAAVRNACKDYISTKEGTEVYAYNCQSFNWADFAMYVPKDICKKHGFEIADYLQTDEQVDLNEQLI